MNIQEIIARAKYLEGLSPEHPDFVSDEECELAAEYLERLKTKPEDIFYKKDSKELGKE